MFYTQSTSAVISGQLTYIEHRKHSGVISSEETFPALMAVSSRNLPFKPCTGCMQWLLTQVSVLFSFFHISLQNKSPHVTSFNQRTIHRWDTEVHPNFTDSINSAKQTRNAEFTGQSSIIVKMPAANTHSVLSFRHFNPISDGNLEIHCSKPVTFTIQRSECNWFHLVLRTTYVAIHSLSANDETAHNVERYLCDRGVVVIVMRRLHLPCAQHYVLILHVTPVVTRHLQTTHTTYSLGYRTSCHLSSAENTYNLKAWLSHQLSLVICRQYIQLNSLVIAPVVTHHLQTTHTI